MADARDLTYGVGFQASDALNAIEQMESGLGDVDEAVDRAEAGAQSCSRAISDMGAAGADAARDAGAAAQRMGADFDDAGDNASDSFRKMGAEADSFGAAFKKTMAAGIQSGQSLAKSFRTGVSGAIAYTQKQFTGFKNDVTKGAKAIGTAFTHPIQTIKGKLVQALNGAADAADDVEDEAKDAERALDDMGAEGSDAGNQVKDAIKGALAAFLSIEAIQAATDAIKEFAGAAVEAAKLGENTSAKFDNLFAGTDVGEWADNYADAVHRSNTEVQGFLVSNQALYTNLGITDDAAAELSKTTTSLAYDFGNAFSMDDTEALTLIQEGIQGNGEALAEYGVKLDEATVKAQAMKMGLGENIDEMDEATLAQVRLASIIEQSSKVQQAAITQTDGLTNSTKSLNGIWTNFMEDAGGKFTPVIEQFLNTIIEAWPTIEPMLLGLVEMLSEGLSQAMPVIMELGQALLPVLTDVLGTVFQAAIPLIDVFGSLAQTVLPPLASILGLLVETLMPPLTEILNVIISLIEPLMPVIQSIAEAILPPIAELLGLMAPILEALSRHYHWLACRRRRSRCQFLLRPFRRREGQQGGGRRAQRSRQRPAREREHGGQPRRRYVAVHLGRYRGGNGGQRHRAGKHHRDQGHHRPQPQDDGRGGQQHLRHDGNRRRNGMEPDDGGCGERGERHRRSLQPHRLGGGQREQRVRKRRRDVHSRKRGRHRQL